MKVVTHSDDGAAGGRFAALLPVSVSSVVASSRGTASSLPAKAMTRGSGTLFSCRSSSTSNLAASTCTARRSLAVVIWVKSITVPGAWSLGLAAQLTDHYDPGGLALWCGDHGG